jgi:hypothetical protein
MRLLFLVEFVETVPLGHILRAIEALAAFSAAIGAVRQEEQDPKFQNASALSAMHVFAPADRTIPFLGVNEQAILAFHWERIIALAHPGGNCPGSVRLQWQRTL